MEEPIKQELNKPPQPSEKPVQTPESPQQVWERLRDEAINNIHIIAANLIDLDEQKVEPRDSAIEILRRMESNISKLPEHPEIYDSPIIGSAHELSRQLIAEIDRKRAERGETPVETAFDTSHIIEPTPIRSNIDSVDLTQLGPSHTKSITDLPREAHEATGIDRSNAMWGRVNVLRHDEVVFGVSHVKTAFDQNRAIIFAHRDLYIDGRYAGRWDQEVNYFRNVSQYSDPNLPKKLVSYEETVFDNANNRVESVKAKLNANGQVYNINYIHYANGEKTGTTQLTFTYDIDGNIVEMKQTRLDSSGNQLSESIKKFPRTNENPIVENSRSPIAPPTLRTVTNLQDHPTPKKPSVLSKISGFFGRR